MRLVLLGPPGAGKGTQAAAIGTRYGVPHVSTGDMLRAAIGSGTAVGKKAKAIVDSGNLVPDDVMADMVRERLAMSDCSAGFLLDGYPRTLAQGVALEGILAGMGASLDHAVYLAIEDAEIVRRLSGRRTCGACGAPYHLDSAPPRVEGICDRCGAALTVRPDDRESVVQQRLTVYRERTEPLVGFYRNAGLLREVRASGSMAEVERRVAAAIDGGGR